MKKIMFLSGLMFLIFNMGFAQARSASTPINLNTADVKQLVTLKGIGMKKAERIVASREHQGAFHSINELSRVRGIGRHFIEHLVKMNKGRLVVSEKS